MPDENALAIRRAAIREEPVAAIVVPVMNQVEYTKLFVQHLLECTDMKRVEVVFIDNGSSDETPEYLASCEFATVVRSERNLGVGPAWNLGTRYSTAGSICFINNDVIVTPGWLDALVAGLEESPDVWCVGPLYTKESLPPNFDDLASAVARMAPRAEVGGLVGFCFLVRRSAYDALGGFDEGYRVGMWEDTDFYVRMCDAGHPPRVVLNSLIHHFGGKTADPMSQQDWSVMMSNLDRFVGKWGRDIMPGRDVPLALSEGIVLFRGRGDR